jgi:acetoin utilization deacetylase AcuC-like enzyme
LDAVEHGLNSALEIFSPELVIYLAGADPYHGDRLGRLTVSKAGLAARDEYVFSLLSDHKIPTAVVLAGGYARDIRDTVDIHLNTVGRAQGHYWQN